MTIRAFLADIDVLVQPLEFINREMVCESVLQRAADPRRANCKAEC